MSGIAMFTIVRSSSVMKNPSDMTISTIHGLPRYLLTMTDLSVLAATRHFRHTALPPHNVAATQLPQSALRHPLGGRTVRHPIAAAITRAAAIPCTVLFPHSALDPVLRCRASSPASGANSDGRRTHRQRGWPMGCDQRGRTPASGLACHFRVRLCLPEALF